MLEDENEYYEQYWSIVRSYSLRIQKKQVIAKKVNEDFLSLLALGDFRYKDLGNRSREWGC